MFTEANPDKGTKTAIPTPAYTNVVDTFTEANPDKGTETKNCLLN